MKALRFALLCYLLGSCGGGDNYSSNVRGSSPQQEQPAGALQIDELVKRSDVVWGFDFLPDGRMVFTEKSGSINLLNLQTLEVTALTGTPPIVLRGEGGLMDLRYHLGQLYFCHADSAATGFTVSVTRATLSGQQLVNVQKIFTANETATTAIHWGCRIEFDQSQLMYLSLGERNERIRAQDLTFHQGKILRLNDDGSTPADNPFLGTPGAQPQIFSLGHRNVQGLAVRPGTLDLWASELGPTGGDEVNIIKAGQNYGWPIISHGVDAGGLIQAETRAGFVDPIAFWVPSISPSALTFYQGDLYLANLSGQHVRRLALRGNEVVRQDVLFSEKNWRFRNLRAGPDGKLYFSTDDGRIGTIHAP